MSDPAMSPAAARYVPKGERAILAVRPGVLFIPLAPLGTIVVILGATWLGVWGLDRLAIAAGGDRELVRRLKNTAGLVGVAGTASIVLRVLWQALEWWCRLYILTDARLLRVSGVLRRSVIDIPVERVQHTSVYRAIRERVFGLGTIGINTSGTAFTEMFWNMVGRPHEVHAAIRAACERRAPTGGAPARPVVLGLAGGIGAGKSAVARELERRGALVIDSDRESRQALDRPEVRGALVEWWGPDILDTSGRVDRSKVGAIVFADPEQRRRLEALVHPIVRHSRAELVAQAGQKGTRLIVVDAPLLFEAGVDRECDKVVFVDAPRQLRIERVRARGWDEAELTRREKAQLPLEEKRARADATITNDSDEATLARRVGETLTLLGL